MRDTLWRKLTILFTIGILLAGSLYVLFNTTLNKNKDSEILEGDPPVEESSPITLGGVVDNPTTNTLSISGIQTAYIQYTKDQITFDEMVQQEEKHLKDVLVVPSINEIGYLTSAGYSDTSATQVYYQSNKEKTRTVIIRVTYGKKENTVSRLYDGGYYRIVDVTKDGKSLTVYNNDNPEGLLEVN